MALGTTKRIDFNKAVIRGFPIGLAGCGMRDLAFFRGDIWDLSRKQGREAGISVASGSGNLCFFRVGMRD